MSGKIHMPAQIDEAGMRGVEGHIKETGHEKYTALSIPPETLADLFLGGSRKVIAIVCTECYWLLSRPPYMWVNIGSKINEDGTIEKLG